MMLTLSVGTTLKAQELNQYNEYMHVDNMQLNENGQGTVDVYFNTTNEYVDGILMRIFLPDGLTIEKNSRGKYVFTFYNGETAMTYDHGGDAMYHENENGKYYMMILDSPTHTFMLPGYTLLFSFNVIADDTFVEPAEAEFKDIRVGGTIVEPVTRFCPDVTFTITPFGYSSITGIESEVQKKDIIYDIYGRKVKQPASGIYIVNGEKRIIR